MVTSGAMLKGASEYLYSLAVPTFLFIHHLKEITEQTPRFPTAMLCKMRFVVNNFNNINGDGALIKYLWIINANRITAAAPAWLGGSETQKLHTQTSYRSIPNTTYLQSSEQPVTLTTQFYHSSPLLPSLTAGIKCALNVYRCRVFTPLFNVEMTHGMGWNAQKILNYVFSPAQGWCWMTFVSSQDYRMISVFIKGCSVSVVIPEILDGFIMRWKTSLFSIHIIIIF